MNLSVGISTAPPSSAERFLLESIAQEERNILASLRFEAKDAQKLMKASNVALLEARTTLTRMRNEVARLEKSLQEKAAILHPLRYLPLEMLAEIFDHCLHRDSESPLPKSPLFVVSQVCRRWRIASFSNPRLWTRLDVNFEPGRLSSRMEAAIHHWLGRSGVCLLDVHFRFPALDRSSFSPQVMEAIMPSVTRWRSLTVEGTIDASILDYFQVPTPNLTLVSIVFSLPSHSDISDIDEDEEMRKIPQRFLSDAPRLTSIKIEDVIWVDFPHHYRALQELKLTNTEMDIREKLLPYMSLKSLECRGDCQNERTIPFPPSHFRHLKHLALDRVSHHRFTDSAMPLAFPALESLTFFGIRDLNFAWSFLRGLPSPALLKVLTLDDSGYISTFQNVDEWLESTIRGLAVATNLRRLTIKHSNTRDHLLVALSTCNGLVEHWPCPQLTEVEFEWCSNITGPALIEFVRTRERASRSGDPHSPKALERVVASQCDGISSWHLTAVQTML